jgi:hypothetical protein
MPVFQILMDSSGRMVVSVPEEDVAAKGFCCTSISSVAPLPLGQWAHLAGMTLISFKQYLFNGIPTCLLLDCGHIPLFSV